jgi:beta-galactosidase/beta-glucuronidase
MKTVKIFFLIGFLSFNSVFVKGQNDIIMLNSTISNNKWKIIASSDLTDDFKYLFSASYRNNNWLNAKVPGTIFNSYVEAGLEKDPNFGDNIYKVDKSKYNQPFWYRTEFEVPSDFAKKIVWLNFNGINKKAEVYLNNNYLGKIEGIVARGKFDVTNIIKTSELNVLMVKVFVADSSTLYKQLDNANSPTYLSSGSWDWMPYVPGLNMGIQDDVYLCNSGAVSIIDPWIRVDLPSNNKAKLEVNVELLNHSKKEQSGTLYGTINPGNITFSHEIKLKPERSNQLILNSDIYKQLIIDNPKLWWPNGMGEQNMYKCNFKFVANNEESDNKTVKFGIRKFTYDTIGSVFHIKINGEKVFCRGGNWGMAEYMLRCQGEEYDLRVKLHKDMNYNMIRNWLGSVTDEEFYDACDKYGMMIWDDFWLNSDGGIPNDINTFNFNAIEKIKRNRNHPSIAVWCGDNEGYPAQPLNDWLRANIKTFDGNDRWYQANSHSNALTGSGMWFNYDPNKYFSHIPDGWGGNPGWGFRTEIGSAVFVNYESLKKFIPKDKLWPRNEMWELHFFGDKYAYNSGSDVYDASLHNRYGKANNIIEYCKKAQLLNIETNKAMYEGWNHTMWNDASGVLTWMSQSAYPSMVWQTYDYYFDPNGAYWGVKKACEPIHIQWNEGVGTVKVINTTLNNYSDLTAEAFVYNQNGDLMKEFSKSAKVSVLKDTLQTCFDIKFPTCNIAYKKNVFASSKQKSAGNVTDNISGTIWYSENTDNQWIYVDLGERRTVTGVGLYWHRSFAKKYKIQVSDDAKTWKDVANITNGTTDVNHISFKPETARYVKMQGVTKGTKDGYWLYAFEVYDKKIGQPSNINFVKLKLSDNSGKILSENFYWSGNRYLDYTSIDKLKPVKLTIIQTKHVINDKCILNVSISNPKESNSLAFAVHVQVKRSTDGERVLPIFMNDNYFSLLKGETKNLIIEFDKSNLNDAEPVVVVEPYNSIKLN